MNIGLFKFFLLFVPLIMNFPPGGKSDYLNYNCNTSAPNTTSSSFDSDLAQLFSSLSNQTSQSGYSTAMAGQGNNTLFGTAMCQAGTNYTDCDTCLSTAETDIVNLCAKKANATIWYDNCMLRYSNADFFSSLDDYSYCMYGLTNVTQDQESNLNTLVSNTMLNLSSQAAYNSSHKFAVGEVNFASAVPLYELVQCTRNLSNDECYQCLSDLVGPLMLANCSSGRLGGRNLGQSCYVRFELVKFFNTSEIPPTDLNTPPPPPSAATSKDDRLEAKLILINIPSIVLVLILFGIFCIIVLRRRLRRRNAIFLTSEGLSHGMDDQEIFGIASSSQVAEQSKQTELVQYSLETLEIVTENFSERRKLGGGRFGEVFQGTIDGVRVAIKKLREDSVPLSRLLDLGKEVTLLAPLSHRNLVWEHWKSNKLLEILDPFIMDECPEEEALQFMLIGLLCVQGDPRKRPDMKHVVEMLRGEASLMEPSYPGYYPEERQLQKKYWLPRIMKI